MMRKSAVNISIIIILFEFLITANGDVCISNDVIKCNNYTSYAECTIYQNNITTISQAISLCSAGSFTEFKIHIDRGLQSTTPTITLNLANNIQNVVVYGYATTQPVYIISPQTHPNVSRIMLYFLVIHNSGTFYVKFPNVTFFVVQYGYFDTEINFSTLKKLTHLYISCSGQSNGNMTMDKEWVGGLSSLQYLTLNSCGIQNITTDAFENLNSLTFLNLGYNNILELSPEVFRDLTALKRLEMGSNRNYIKIPIDSKNNNAFSPLKQLTSLYLTNTKIIPFDAFSTISSIQELNLPQISTGIVPSTPLQHLHKLTLLSFYGISPICNCSMQWASIIGKFGINIQNGRCINNGNYVTDSSLYTECGLTESYQCFNKTVACKNTCINTPDSYICACDAGYGLSLTEAVCHDIDECSNSTWNTCKQHLCLNQVGSYRCICDPGYYLSQDGFSCHDFGSCNGTNNQQIYSNGYGIYSCICKVSYKLSLDGTSCEDINECNMIYLNSCDHQCLNEPGSYRCICDAGFELAVNNISCHYIDECTNSNNSCNPHECLNLVGSYTCLCGEGYNLTTNGKSCEDINECNSPVLNKCDQHECINKNGSYTCNCQQGYQLIVDGDRRSCKDIDECQNINKCAQRCVNNFGSYECECNDGFTLSVESGQGEQSLICQDINECELNSNLCSQLCINTNGSYYCDCDEKYRIDSTNVSACLAIYHQSNLSNSQFVSEQPFNNSATSYYNGTFIGVTVLLVIIIITLILLLLTSLSIIIYMCYNKRKIVQFQELPEQHEAVELLSNNQTDLASPEENSGPYYSEIGETTYYYTPRLNVNVTPNLENIEDMM